MPVSPLRNPTTNLDPATENAGNVVPTAESHTAPPAAHAEPIVSLVDAPPPPSAKGNNASVSRHASSLNKPNDGRDGLRIHVTFENAGENSNSGLEARRTASGLRQLGSSVLLNDNGSIFTNGSIRRTASGLMSGNTGGNIPASSPLQMLYQSFRNPVSDAQAIENTVREILGRESVWRQNGEVEGAASPPVVVRDGDDEQAAIAALSTGDALRGCTDPLEHYIFRNCILAPRGERPQPYLFAEEPHSPALNAAVAALRCASNNSVPNSVTSVSERTREPAREAAVPSARHTGKATTAEASQQDNAAPPLTHPSGAATEAGSRPPAPHLPSWLDEPTSSDSTPTMPHQANVSHEPDALPSSSNDAFAKTGHDTGAATAATAAATTAAAAAAEPLTATEEVARDSASKINRTYLVTGAFHAEPIADEDIEKEELIIDTFNALPSEQRRMELLEAFYVAHMQPYEQNASYTADDWDDMTREKTHRWFAIEFVSARGYFFVTVFKRRMRVFLFSFLFRAFCLFLFWVVMFCLVPKNWFYPGGLYFDTIDTIVFSGIAGTLFARLLSLPSIVGVIWAGILWNNVPYTTRLTAGITLDMRQFISMFGLTIGLIRAGLSLNVIRFKQKFKHYITFSLLPMAMEMLVHGICCKFIYNYPNYRWAFAEGFLLSSIAPSVVVPVIIAFQRRGYGVRDGPSMMMLCSIAVDTAVCVWGVEFLLAIEFHKMDTTLLIVLAPIQVVVGLVGGVLLGALVFVVTFYILFMEGERVPSVRSDRMLTLRHSVHVRYISIFFMVLVAFSGIAIGKRFSVLGGSAIGVVTIAGTFNYLCVRGGTADHLRVKADMAQTLTTVWDYLAMPSLFGLSGAAVNVHELFSRSFIGQAFGLVFIGMGTRSIFAMLVPIMTRLGLSWPEILFCGVGWIGKGSVQGSLGSLAQTYAAAELAAATTAEARAVAAARVEFGRKMKNTAILGVLVACPLCSVFLTNFTHRLLKPNT